MIFVLELLDVVLIWVVTRTTRSLPIVWALALMFLLLVVVLGMGYMFSKLVESVAMSRPDPALEELRIAYARGEITREEFRERRADLRGERDESATESHRPGEQNPDWRRRPRRRGGAGSRFRSSHPNTAKTSKRATSRPMSTGAIIRVAYITSG